MRANTKSQWIRLANWKINSVAVAGIDKEKQSRKNFCPPLSLPLGVFIFPVYVYLHTHWQAFHLLMISHFAYGISLLFVLFVLLCVLQLHSFSYIYIHTGQITHWRCCGFSSFSAATAAALSSRKTKEIKQKAQRFISLWSKLNELILIRPVGKIFPTLLQMKTHKKGVGWPCGRGRWWACPAVALGLSLGRARCELYFMPAAITIE